MTNNNITTEELFSTIKECMFADVPVEKVADMTEKEQNEFMLQQVDRLIGMKIKFYDLFYTTEEGRMQKDYNPCLDPKAREEMTEEQRSLCKFYLDVAGLLHDLWCHYEFDPIEIGVRTDDEEFFVSNEPLVKWMKTTPYNNIALRIALTMRQKAADLMEEVGYDAAEKFISKLNSKDMNAILDGLKAVDDHLTEGLERGMSHEEIFRYDARKGGFQTSFS